MILAHKKILSAFSVSILAILLGLFIYAHAFDAPFQFDDNRTIVENPAIKHLADVRAIWDFDPSRFLTHYSFALNYYFSDVDVHSYHVVNFILHLLVCFLVYIFLNLTFQTQTRKISNSAQILTLAVFGALLFLSHPVQTQCVIFTVQRANLLAALFYLATLILYIFYRRRNNQLCYILALVMALMGVFTKPNFITLPLAILLYEIYFFNVSDLKKFKGLMRIVPFFLIVSIIPFLLLLWRHQAIDFSSILDATRETPKIARKDYLLTQFNVFMTYFRLLILPINQNLDYDYPIARNLFSFPTFLSFSVLVGIFALAVRTFKTQKLFSFAIVWFFLTLSIESSIFPISDVIFEHRLYLPMVGFVMIVPFYLRRFIADKKLFIILMCAIIALMSIVSYRRNEVWRDRIGLLLDIVKKSPNKARVHNNLAVEYHNMGDFDYAEREYKQAISLDQHYAHPHNNLGDIYMMRGQIDEAKKELDEAITIKPNYEAPYYNLGNIYQKLGDTKKAAENYLKALKINPSFAQAHAALGGLYLTQGDLVRAKFHLFEAIRFNPDFEQSYYHLGDVYLNEKNFQEAIAQYRKAIERKPDTYSAYNNIGNIFDMTGNLERAKENYLAAIAINPQYANAYFNLANTARKLGQIKESVEMLMKARDLYQSQKNEKMVLLCEDRLKELYKAIKE